MRDNCVNISDVSSLTHSFCSASTLNTGHSDPTHDVVTPSDGAQCLHGPVSRVLQRQMSGLQPYGELGLIDVHGGLVSGPKDEFPLLLHQIQLWSGGWREVRYSCWINRQSCQSRVVTETKLLPVIGRFGVPSAVKSQGRLSARQGAPSSLMEVVWNTGLVSSANAKLMGPLLSDMEYVILDTDYTTRALICSCQDLNMGFFAANRRSCALLVVRIRTHI